MAFGPQSSQGSAGERFTSKLTHVVVVLISNFSWVIGLEASVSSWLLAGTLQCLVAWVSPSGSLCHRAAGFAQRKRAESGQDEVGAFV